MSLRVPTICTNDMYKNRLAPNYALCCPMTMSSPVPMLVQVIITKMVVVVVIVAVVVMVVPMLVLVLVPMLVLVLEANAPAESASANYAPTESAYKLIL